MDFLELLRQQKEKAEQQMAEDDALAEPSIMDEWAKQNDPKQYEKIQRARNRKFAMEAAMQGGATMGTIKPPAFKGIFNVLQGGKAAPTAEEALSTGVKRIVKDAYPEHPDLIKQRGQEMSDSLKELTERLRQDPNIPIFDKKEAAKTLPSQERFELMKRRPTIQDEIMSQQRVYDDAMYRDGNLRDSIKDNKIDLNKLQKLYDQEGLLSTYEALKKKRSQIDRLNDKFETNRNTWHNTDQKMEELMNNRDQNFGKILELIKKK